MIPIYLLLPLGIHAQQDPQDGYKYCNLENRISLYSYIYLTFTYIHHLLHHGTLGLSSWKLLDPFWRSKQCLDRKTLAGTITWQHLHWLLPGLYQHNRAIHGFESRMCFHRKNRFLNAFHHQQHWLNLILRIHHQQHNHIINFQVIHSHPNHHSCKLIFTFCIVITPHLLLYYVFFFFPLWYTSYGI